MKPFQRIGKRDKPLWLEEQEEEPCQRVRKRDKPVEYSREFQIWRVVFV